MSLKKRELYQYNHINNMFKNTIFLHLYIFEKWWLHNWYLIILILSVYMLFHVRKPNFNISFFWSINLKVILNTLLWSGASVKRRVTKDTASEEESTKRAGAIVYLETSKIPHAPLERVFPYLHINAAVRTGATLGRPHLTSMSKNNMHLTLLLSSGTHSEF